MPNISIDVICKSLSPMITSGADLGEYDLRAPEVKGLLRYWWRAFHDFPDRQRMQLEEAALFGDSKSNAAPFRLNVIVNQSEVCTRTDLGLNDQDKKDRSYFYFPLRKGDRAAEKPTFTISFNGIRTLKQATDLLYTLWLLENLGGIGSRARRGAGSFQVEALDACDEVKQIWLDLARPGSFSSLEDFGNWLKASLAKIKKRWGVHLSSSPQPSSSLPPYTRWSESSQICLILDHQSDQMALMDALAKNMRDYRDGGTKKQSAPAGAGTPFQQQAKALHQRVDQMVVNGPLASLGGVSFTKAAFGLPIQYCFGARHKQPEPLRLYASPMTKRTENGKEYLSALERRASPLFLSFGKALVGGDERAYCIMSFIPAQFAGDQEKSETSFISFTAELDENPVETRIGKLSGEIANAQTPEKKRIGIKHKKDLEARLAQAKAIKYLSKGGFMSAFPGYGAVTGFLRQLSQQNNIETRMLYP